MTALTAYALFVAASVSVMLYLGRQARIVTEQVTVRTAAAERDFEREFGLAIGSATEPIHAAHRTGATNDS